MKTKIATVGGGCFWCTEAIFNQIKGVEKVVSGYAGGNVPGYPTYKEVCSGLTGHAEVIQISYNPEVISYQEILIIFMTTHDPTTLNRQGADVGTQYRSVIYYHTKSQQMLAEEKKRQLNAQDAYGAPVVTEISAFDVFYSAEDYHQDYYDQNPGNPYCSRVVGPKLEKFRKVFKEKLAN